MLQPYSVILKLILYFNIIQSRFILQDNAKIKCVMLKSSKIKCIILTYFLINVRVYIM